MPRGLGPRGIAADFLMKVHEYQAKELFARYGIPVPRGQAASTANEAAYTTGQLGGKAVIKAQVHAGGRGQAGGIKVVGSPEEALAFATSMLGHNLVTAQTGPEGAPVRQLLVEETADITREIYLAITVDRDNRRPVVLASASGGMDIEQVAASNPGAILSEVIDPVLGLMPFQVRRLASGLGLDARLTQEVGRLMGSLYRLFVEADCSLAEINPLVITGTGELLALDGKVNLEDDAMFRHPEFRDLADPSQENELENRASELGIAYVKLDGNVGCLVNGAGLAMATMDVISAQGSRAANFLDVGGGASVEKVSSAVDIILADEDVDRVLVNFFGGILRCDIAAEGIVAAYQAKGSRYPLVVRMLGTNAEQGKAILRDSGLPVTFFDTMTEAAAAIAQIA